MEPRWVYEIETKQILSHPLNAGYNYWQDTPDIPGIDNNLNYNWPLTRWELYGKRTRSN